MASPDTPDRRGADCDDRPPQAPEGADVAHRGPEVPGPPGADQGLELGDLRGRGSIPPSVTSILGRDGRHGRPPTDRPLLAARTSMNDTSSRPPTRADRIGLAW